MMTPLWGDKPFERVSPLNGYPPKDTAIVNQVWEWQVRHDVDFNHKMSWNDAYTLMKNIAAFCQGNTPFTSSQHRRDMIDQHQEHDRVLATTVIMNYYKEDDKLGRYRCGDFG